MINQPPEEDKPWYQEIFHDFVRFLVLVWSAGILTASYLGYLEKMDPTFVATLLMSCASSYGIHKIAQNGNKPKVNPTDKPSPPPSK